MVHVHLGHVLSLIRAAHIWNPSRTCQANLILFFLSECLSLKNSICLWHSSKHRHSNLRRRLKRFDFSFPVKPLISGDRHILTILIKMESILARALEYTLKYWLKSFSRDQFKWQGRTVQLSNLGKFCFHLLNTRIVF